MRIELTYPAWKAGVLPLNYARKPWVIFLVFREVEWAEKDSNPRSASATDLQSVPVDHLGICPIMSYGS